MKTPLRVLIAEDTLEAREILVEELNNLDGEYKFEIVQCETPDKVFSKLSEYSKQNIFFDVAFVDIDFQEARAKGGRRDSGFMIISKTFETCPFTKICTYSGQFRAFDLTDQHQDLVRRGLILYSFDKSYQSAGEKDWFYRGFRKVLEDIDRDLILWDVWENSIMLTKVIKSLLFDSDNLKNAQIQLEVITLIESIYPLIKVSVENNDCSSIDTIIKNYHTVLESFCRQGKNNTEILADFENNRNVLEQIIGKQLEFNNKITAFTIIAAYNITDLFKYGDKLNYYRNRVSHPNSGFNSNIINLVYSHLVVCLYILGKNTSFSYIKHFSFLDHNSGQAGVQDLMDIISHLESL